MKTARHLPQIALGSASQPLSGAAFDSRFVAPLTASAQPQRFASRLLASPQPNDVQSAFTARVADAAGAVKEAQAFRLPQLASATASTRTPDMADDAADGNVVLAMAEPSDLPRMLDIEPAPAPKRLPPVAAKPDDSAKPQAAAKPDPRSAGKKLAKPADASADDEDTKPVLRAGKSAKAPVVVASLPPQQQAPAKHKTLWQALGFAKPDNPDEDRPGRNIPWPGGGKKVAYYDISAQRVYLPNGESMEAHSGQGKWRDNPAYADVKMRGPTPPSTYKLSMRETPFHGVQALRLTPTNGINPHGRVGLLTHSYLRRRPGDSAGCIAFKDYPRFLAAYKRGEVDQVVVVPSMGKTKAFVTKVASAVSGSR